VRNNADIYLQAWYKGQRLKNLKSYVAITGFAILALAGASAWAQAPAVSKASKSGEPVFLDPTALIQSAPAKPAAPIPAVAPAKASSPTAASPATNAGLMAIPTATGYVADDKYKLRVGDRISLQILEDRDAPKSLIIADSGELDAPYIGRVTAADKTCKQVAEELKAQLEKEYYHRATVIISLDAANKLLGRVYVWGQVRNQGPIELAANETITAGKAILRVGGFADFANKKKVKVVRGGGADGANKQTFELNMVEILEGGKTEKDIPLQPDDLVIVPSRLISF
jgi:polysaccharide biosynthesis/export protein